MRSSWSILAATAVLALPPAASAQSSDLFGQFQRACVQANAKPAAVAAAAKGWRSAKAPDGRFDRAKAWSRDGYILVSGVQKLNGVERRTCSLSGPADRRAQAAAQAWAGGRSAADGAVGTYLLLDVKTAPRAATAEEARDWRKVGRVSGLAVSTAEGVTTLGLSTFAKANDYREQDAFPASFDEGDGFPSFKNPPGTLFPTRY